MFEALAAGAVPIVVDFGGPGDIVHPEIGYKVPLTSEADVVAKFEKLAIHVLPKPQVEQLRDAMLGLEKLGINVDNVVAHAKALIEGAS